MPSDKKSQDLIPKADVLYDESIILTIVCDLRDFTDLTARVDRYIRSDFTSASDKINLYNAYRDYVYQTQSIARKELTRGLDNQQIALKATGDGYMMCVKLKDVNIFDIQSSLREHQNKTYSVIHKSIENLCKLVSNAHSDSYDPETIRFLTERFIEEYGLKIGMEKEWIDEKGILLIAGAVTLGVGLLWPGSEELKQGSSDIHGAHPSEERELRPVSYGEALGHNVNLCFRLCNEAGRPISDNEITRSSLILMDRRVAYILLEHNQSIREGMFKIRPIDYPLHVKGIEEIWHYCLEKQS